MKIKAFLLLASLCLTITSHAAEKKKTSPIRTPIPQGNDIKFIYEPFEGDGYAVCTQERWAQSPYDWDVLCPDGKDADGNQKIQKYVAHLALSQYSHPSAPKLSYELLYWVNGNGATTWFHLEEPSSLMTVESSQSITGREATLRLILKVNVQPQPNPFFIPELK